MKKPNEQAQYERAFNGPTKQPAKQPAMPMPMPMPMKGEMKPADMKKPGKSKAC